MYVPKQFFAAPKTFEAETTIHAGTGVWEQTRVALHSHCHCHLHIL